MVRGQLHILVGIDLGDLEWPGAGSDRIDLAILIGGWREDRSRRACHLRRQQHRWLDGRDLHDIVATSIDGSDQLGRKGPSRNGRLEKIGECIDCGRSVKRLAVLELHALAQLEFPDLRRGLCPGFGQPRLQCGVIADADQAFETPRARTEIGIVGGHLPAGLDAGIIVIGDRSGCRRLRPKRDHNGARRQKCVLHHRRFPFYF
ncbi:hypothetical protein D3C78_1254800 [compost metagenome]